MPDDALGSPAERPVARPRVSADQRYALLLLLLVLGLGAAIYAAGEVIDPQLANVCSTSSFISCKAVATSGHTTVAGVPDYAIGIVGYAAMLALGVLAFRTYDRRYLQGLLGLSLLGLLFTAVFVYEETVVIGAICPVCTTAHAANLGVLAITLGLLRLSRPERADVADRPAG